MQDEDNDIQVEFFGPLGRLVKTKDADTEEVVASFQGLLCKKELPPIVAKFSANRSNILYKRQSLTLTGYGEETFEEVVRNVAQVHALIKRSVGDTLQECTALTTFREHPALDMSNRFFTPRADANPDDECDFERGVDPFGHLRKAGGESHVHTAENKVVYFEKRANKGGDYLFNQVSPAVFQEGDIVEVQVSFVVLPLRDHKKKMAMILRSLTLLDAKYSQDALVKRSTARTKQSVKAKGTLKRRVGYAEEQVSVTRAKMSEMQIDDKKDEEVAEKGIVG